MGSDHLLDRYGGRIDEDHLGVAVVAGARPIVMIQGKIDRLDANIIGDLVHQAMGTALDMARTLTKLGFKRSCERPEKIQYQGMAAFYAFSESGK
jgi:putative NIF3 family GTP cyclohydrolase 1 type 2